MNSNTFHPYIMEEHKDIYSTVLKDQKHIIFYGGEGLGKYYQSIEFIRQYSPSKLKYNKKMLIDDEEYCLPWLTL